MARKRAEHAVNIANSTMRDVAVAAGVSSASVSRAMNGTGYLGGAVKKRILSAAERLGYSPRYAIRKDLIMIVVKSSSTFPGGVYETQLLAHLVRRLKARDCLFSIISCDEFNVLSTSMARGFVGILSQKEDIERIRSSRKAPVVLINRRVAGMAGVFCDQKASLRRAVRYLFDHGHRRIALTIPEIHGIPSEQRLQGYYESLRELGADPDERLVRLTGDKVSYIEAVSGILEAGATALIVVGEDQVLQATYAMGVLGRKIPGDLSMISYENPLISDFLLPSQTTICQPLEKMAEAAVDMLVGMLKSRSVKPAWLEVPSTLIERNSVAPLAAGKS